MTDFTDDEIGRFLTAREAELFDSQLRVVAALDTQFRDSLPVGGGTYAFFHGDSIFYVGETTSLRQRLATHMRNPENHVLLLKIARLLYDQEHGDGTAGKMKKFEEAHKKKTRAWVRNNLHVAHARLSIGRKELEEMLVSKHSPPFNERYPKLPCAGGS